MAYLLKYTLTYAAGTKWCGAGDIAENYHDLGRETQIDRSV